MDFLTRLHDAPPEAAAAVAAMFRKLRLPTRRPYPFPDALHILQSEIDVVTQTRYWAVALQGVFARVALCMCDAGAFFMDTTGRLWGVPLVGPAATAFAGSVFDCHVRSSGTVTVVDVAAYAGSAVTDPFSTRLALIDKVFAVEEDGEDRENAILAGHRVFSMRTDLTFRPADVALLRHVPPSDTHPYVLVPEAAVDRPPIFLVNAAVALDMVWSGGKLWFGDVDDMHNLPASMVAMPTFAGVPSGSVVSVRAAEDGVMHFLCVQREGVLPTPAAFVTRGISAATHPVKIIDVAACADVECANVLSMRGPR